MQVWDRAMFMNVDVQNGRMSCGSWALAVIWVVPVDAMLDLCLGISHRTDAACTFQLINVIHRLGNGL